MRELNYTKKIYFTGPLQCSLSKFLVNVVMKPLGDYILEARNILVRIW